jgi:hypothetical protein
MRFVRKRRLAVRSLIGGETLCQHPLRRRLVSARPKLNPIGVTRTTSGCDRSPALCVYDFDALARHLLFASRMRLHGREPVSRAASVALLLITICARDTSGPDER